MNDLLKQVAKPQPDSTKPDSKHILVGKRSNINTCPCCAGLKCTVAKVCFECRKKGLSPRTKRREEIEGVFIIDGERCRKIPLTQKQTMYVDESRYLELNRYNWFATWNDQVGGYYAATKLGGKMVKAHRMVLGLAVDEPDCDHRNGNGLDNRKSNLRPCNQTQNNLNRKLIQKNNTSGYKGVTKNGNRWIARVIYNGHQFYLGRFASPLEAAKVRDKAISGLDKGLGEFAKLNFSG